MFSVVFWRLWTRTLARSNVCITFLGTQFLLVAFREFLLDDLSEQVYVWSGVSGSGLWTKPLENKIAYVLS